jgi:AAA-like domain/TIR domain
MTEKHPALASTEEISAMLDPEARNAQISLLHTCRRTLWVYLQQQTALGDYAPPAVVTGIADMRAQIQGIKDELRQHGVEVADQPGDHPPMIALASESGAQARITGAAVFISYKRRTVVDEPLARQIFGALAQAGHRPFIDQTLQVGVDWAREIEQQITTSDYFIILLSTDAVQSEMVAREVELAQRAARNGRARMLPVRVAFDEPLPYQLSHLLDHLQYAVWHTDVDTTPLIAQLLTAVSGQATLPVFGSPAFTLAENATPPPSADPRFMELLRIPGGGLRRDSPFYIERDGDAVLQTELAKSEGVTVTIRAPRQSGKTSLLVRAMAHAQQRTQRLIFIDLQAVERRFLEDYELFTRHLASRAALTLRIDPAIIDRLWQSSYAASDKLTIFFSDHVLADETPAVLALDEADRLQDAPFRDDFFGLLRAWTNDRAINPFGSPFDRLNILQVIATEPSMLIQDVNRSPFNVGTKIVLNDLTVPQVADLAQRYRAPIDATQRDELMRLLGGHPYLTSRALYALIADHITWSDLLRSAPTSGGLFGDHLRAQLTLLGTRPELRDAVGQVLARGRCPDEATFYRLVQAGLVRGADAGACRMRNELYAHYFRNKV